MNLRNWLGRINMAAAISIMVMMNSAMAMQNSPLQVSLSMERLPNRFVWAWERAEDLNFIDSRDVGVAYLATTIHIRKSGVDIHPRLQPLRVPANTKMVAVIRVDVDPAAQQELTTALVKQLSETILQFSNFRNVGAIQIDFDARLNEREFYRKLLDNVHRQLPPSCGLSITALSSWCSCDNWMSGLPVDEIVPMMFSMGAQGKQVVDRLKAGYDFSHPLCLKSLGISVNEPGVNKDVISLIGRRRNQMRIYIFNSKPWSKSEFENIRREISDE